MIRHIILKEILENLLSLRFVLSLVLVISLFAASGFVFVGKFTEQSTDYWAETNKNLSGLRGECSDALYKAAFHKQTIWRKPNSLSFCAEGFEKSLPNCFITDAFTSDLPQIKGRGNFALPHFSNIDWVFIISTVLSFVALVLSYDSVSGEREAGTLRLMLSNTIPRHKVLLGKYAGAMLTLAIPLIIGMLVSIIVIILSKDITISGDEWLKILEITILSLLYLSIFVFLGMFVSSRTAHSPNCMVLLLVVWVVLVILLPGGGRIFADIFSQTPTQVELERRLDEVGKEIWDNSDKFGKNAGTMSHDPNYPGNNPPARARLKTALTNAANQVRDDHHNQLLTQAEAGRNPTFVSPVAIYTRASEIIVGTGINRCADIYRQVRDYQVVLKESVRTKDMEDPDSLHLVNPELSAARSWKTISHKPVGFDTVPKFQERDLALGQSLKLVIWDIGLLVLFNLVFFAASYVSFLRYDVR
ncbi:MAG: ABC transporter permease subunit [Planctomycetes bacterium]|nr:ABC transporter permease subunit [Planctomycetota bacterium]